MSVTASLLETLSGGKTIEDKTVILSSQEVWAAHTDNPSSTEQDILACDALPRLWSIRLRDGAQVVNQHASVRAKSNGLIWDVTISYETRKAGTEGGAEAENEAGHWDIGWDKSTDKTQQDQYYAWKEILGSLCNVPLENSAGLPFDPVIQETIYDDVYTLSYKYWTLPDGIKEAPIGKMNDAEVKIDVKGTSYTFPKWSLLLDDVSYRIVDDVPPSYWEITIRLIYRKDTYKTSLRDTSKMKVAGGSDSGDVSREAITDNAGFTVASPVDIGANGLPLGAGEGPHWLHFYLHPEADFDEVLSGYIAAVGSE